MVLRLGSSSTAAVVAALAAAASLCACGGDEFGPVVMAAAGAGQAGYAGHGAEGGEGGGQAGAGGQSPACDATSCDGCCQPDGSCAPGAADGACGYEGLACADCSATGRLCEDGICINPQRLPNGLVDDETLFARTDADVERMRRDLTRFIWGDLGYPATLPVSVTTDVANPAPGVTGFERIDEIEITMDLDFESWAYLFHPPAGSANNALVVYHQGHSDGLGPNGGVETINQLLAGGYAVLGFQMPLKGPNQGPVADHDAIIALASDTLGYDPIRFFVEPVIVGLNYAEQSFSFDRLGMIGISGGGWTTTLVAALEPRIQFVFPVAGTLPLTLRVGADKGDSEQYYEALYQIAGYPDLYVLGSAGPDRIHVQVLNRNDSCCFAGLSYRSYEPTVAAQVAGLAGGSYRVFLDESHLVHQISPHALGAVVLPELAGGDVRFADDVEPTYGRYSTVGVWTPWTQTGFGWDLQSVPAGNGDLRARWQIPVQPGTYRVSATWVPAANRATDATYIIEGSTAATVNQQLAPASRTDAGASWEDLATDVAVADSTLEVELSNLADGYVIADGIRVERLSN